MSQFQPIGLNHKPLFDEMRSYERTESSSDSFGNVFLWDILCRRNAARLGDRLGVEYLCPRGIFYAFPIGRGPLAPAIEALSSRAAQQGVSLCLHGVTDGQKAALEEAMPGAFTYREDRDNFDYIYDIEAMAALSGKKLHGKRNFCNRFEAAHQWRFVPLSPAGFDDCRALLREWAEEKGGGNPEEAQAIETVFRCWDALGFSGGVLYAEEKAAAFTIGERLTEDSVDVHFEKALEGVPGAYPMVAREYARHLRETIPELRWLNREEDMGIPNLRKAKEEWYPHHMLEKWIALRRTEA